MLVLRLTYAAIRYCNDLAFFLAISFALFFLFLVHDAGKLPLDTTLNKDTSGVSATLIQITDIQMKAVDSTDEVQTSFLLVSSPEGSHNDIPSAGSAFQRLRAQSVKTVQTLIEHRRQMVQKTAAMRARKDRIKRADKTFYSRRPNF